MFLHIRLEHGIYIYMKSLSRMLAEFAKADKKKNTNLLPKILIGAGLLGAGTFAVKGFLRNGKYVRPHLRKGGGAAPPPTTNPGRSAASSQPINAMSLKTAQEVLDNHQSVLRVVVDARQAKRFAGKQVLNPEDLDDLMDNARYWRIDPKNAPTPSSIKLRNTPLSDQDEFIETLIEVPHTSPVSSDKLPYYIKERYNRGQKGAISSIRPLSDLSGLEGFIRV